MSATTGPADARERSTGAYAPLQTFRRILAYSVLTFLSAIFCIPFFWLISTSLKVNSQLFAFPIVWIPNPITFEHYIEGLQYVPFARYVANTLYICAMTVIGALISNTLVAYGLARVRWVLRLPIFYAILATMMIPYQVTMIPLFIVYRNLKWLDSYRPLIIPAFFANGMYIFLLRQFFMSIPMELSEAAEVDGANELTIFFSIILPLTKPALAAIALFQFLAAWGDFLGPLIYVSDVDRYTVSLGLSLFRGQYTTEYGALMASSAVMMLPVIVLFFLTQRTFIEGITLTGIKG